MTAVVDALDAATAPETVEAHARWSGLRTLVRDPAAAAGLALIGLFVVAAVLAPWIAPSRDPNAVDFLHTYAAPSLHHPLGTDDLGRDELSRLLFGARISLGMTVAAALGTSLIGLVLGLAAGWYGRSADMVIMRVVDGLQAIPALILALAVAGILGAGLVNMGAAIVAVWWPGYARVVRGMALSARERQFVDASRAMGASDMRLLVRHVLPNVVGPAVVLTTLDMAHILLAVAGLSFLGLGARPPTPEWGSMLATARAYLDRAPQLLAYPGAAISLMALAFNLMGDGLRDVLDPRLQRRVLG